MNHSRWYQGLENERESWVWAFKTQKSDLMWYLSDTCLQMHVYMSIEESHGLINALKEILGRQNHLFRHWACLKDKSIFCYHNLKQLYKITREAKCQQDHKYVKNA